MSFLTERAHNFLRHADKGREPVLFGYQDGELLLHLGLRACDDPEVHQLGRLASDEVLELQVAVVLALDKEVPNECVPRRMYRAYIT